MLTKKMIKTQINLTEHCALFQLPCLQAEREGLWAFLLCLIQMYTF